MTRYFIDVNVNSTKIYKNDCFSKPLFIKNKNNEKIYEFKNSVTHNIITDDIHWTPFDNIFEQNHFSVFERFSYCHGVKIDFATKLFVYISDIIDNIIKTKNCEIVFILTCEICNILLPTIYEEPNMHHIELIFKEVIDAINKIKNIKIILKGCLMREFLFIGISRILSLTSEKVFISVSNNIFFHIERDSKEQNLQLSRQYWGSNCIINKKFYNVFVNNKIKDKSDFQLKYYNIIIPVGLSYEIEVIKENNYSMDAQVINMNPTVEINGLIIKAIKPGKNKIVVRSELTKEISKVLEVEVVEKTKSHEIIKNNNNCIFLNIDDEVKLYISKDLTTINRMEFNSNIIDVFEDKIIAKSPGYTAISLDEYKFLYYDDETLKQFFNQLFQLRTYMDKENYNYLIEYIYHEKEDLDEPYVILYLQDEKVVIDCKPLIEYKIKTMEKDLKTIFDNLHDRNNKNIFCVSYTNNITLKKLLEKYCSDNDYHISIKYTYEYMNTMLLKYADIVINENDVRQYQQPSNLAHFIFNHLDINPYLDISFYVFDGLRFNYFYDILDTRHKKKINDSLNINPKFIH